MARQGRVNPHGMRTLALSLILTVALAGPASARDCEGMLRMHGFLRRAANQCAFDRYNPSIVDAARQCFDVLAPGVGASSMYAGADEFDRMASLRGRDPACSDIGRRFPMVVR